MLFDPFAIKKCRSLAILYYINTCGSAIRHPMYFLVVSNSLYVCDDLTFCAVPFCGAFVTFCDVNIVKNG